MEKEDNLPSSMNLGTKLPPMDSLRRMRRREAKLAGTTLEETLSTPINPKITSSPDKNQTLQTSSSPTEKQKRPSVTFKEDSLRNSTMPSQDDESDFPVQTTTVEIFQKDIVPLAKKTREEILKEDDEIFEVQRNTSASLEMESKNDTILNQAKQMQIEQETLPSSVKSSKISTLLLTEEPKNRTYPIEQTISQKISREYSRTVQPSQESKSQPTETTEKSILRSITQFFENLRYLFTPLPLIRPLFTSEQIVEKPSLRMLENTSLMVTIEKSNFIRVSNRCLHPCVKVSLIDLTTGNYLPSASNSKEFIFPELTAPFYFRDNKAFQQPIWNSTLIFDTNVTNLLEVNSIIVFEIVDFGKDVKTNSIDGMNRIAWGYLPLSSKIVSLGKPIQIQLYKYPLQLLSRFISTITQLIKKTPIAEDHFNLLELIYSQPKIRYGSAITVQLKWIARPKPTTVLYPSIARYFFEKEVPQEPYTFATLIQQSSLVTKEEILTELGLEKKLTAAANSEEEEDEYIQQCKIQRWKRVRGEEEECLIPNKCLHTLETSTKGSLCVAFNPTSDFLAVACTDTKTSKIRIYSMLTGVLLIELQKHMGIIYDLCWSNDSSYLLSASGDATVKVWKTDSQQMISVLEHPEFVYTAKFHPKHQHLLFSGCFDGKLRIWNWQKQEFIEEFSNHKARIHRIEFDPEGRRLFSSDNNGIIMVWNARMENGITSDFKLIKIINDKYITKTGINCIRIHYTNPIERLLVHSQDNTIRMIDVTSKRVLHEYRGVRNSLNAQKSAISPDGRYIISGSFDGSVYIWNALTEELIDSQEGRWFGFDDQNPVFDIVWSKQEHLIALCSYGSSEPVRVYCFEKSIKQQQLLLLRSKVLQMNSSIVPPLPPIPSPHVDTELEKIRNSGKV